MTGLSGIASYNDSSGAFHFNVTVTTVDSEAWSEERMELFQEACGLMRQAIRGTASSKPTETSEP